MDRKCKCGVTCPSRKELKMEKFSIKHAETVARRKCHAPEGFEVFKWEAIGSDAVSLTGGIPRIITRGPRKGKKTWNKCIVTTEIVTKSEADAEQDKYEKETGRCGECMGEGKLLSGWSRDSGYTYRECSRCKGSGKADEAV